MPSAPVKSAGAAGEKPGEKPACRRAALKKRGYRGGCPRVALNAKEPINEDIGELKLKGEGDKKKVAKICPRIISMCVQKVDHKVTLSLLAKLND